MGKVSSGRRAYSWAEGKRAEGLFVTLMEKRGNDVEKSSSKVDIKQHIDYYVNGVGFDVKGNRHLDCIWLEIANVRGDDGWLKGEAEYIAFHFPELDEFIIFGRQDLLEWVQQNVTEYTDDKKDYLKLYTRKKWDRKDLIVKVRFSDIESLSHTRISC